MIELYETFSEKSWVGLLVLDRIAGAVWICWCWVDLLVLGGNGLPGGIELLDRMVA